MVMLVIGHDAECRLRQMSADLDLTPEALAGCLLESALLVTHSE